MASGNWIVDNLNHALETWNNKLSDINYCIFADLQAHYIESVPFRTEPKGTLYCVILYSYLGW